MNPTSTPGRPSGGEVPYTISSGPTVEIADAPRPRGEQVEQRDLGRLLAVHTPDGEGGQVARLLVVEVVRGPLGDRLDVPLRRVRSHPGGGRRDLLRHVVELEDRGLHL